MRGGVVDGIQGEGGFIRRIPDSGGVRWCLVGLCSIGEGVCVVGLVGWSVCVCERVCVYTFIVGVSFMVGVYGFECLGESYMVSVWCGCGVMSCCECETGLWCPSMRGGDVVGDQGGGCWRMRIPDRGGVRWCLVGDRNIGERVIGGCGYVF